MLVMPVEMYIRMTLAINVSLVSEIQLFVVHFITPYECLYDNYTINFWCREELEQKLWFMLY